MGLHQKRKGDQFSQPALAVMMIMLLLKTNCCRAAVVVKSNSSTTYQCNGLDGCRIEEDLELELDFFMDSNIIRILQAQGGNSGIDIHTTLKKDKPAVEPCGPPQSGPCLGEKKPPANCGPYNRECK